MLGYDNNNRHCVIDVENTNALWPTTHWVYYAVTVGLGQFPSVVNTFAREDRTT
jgi:hypothetical protein